MIRTSILISAAALLAACGNGTATDTTATTNTVATSGDAERTPFERPDDHAIGNPNAAVTVMEFASVTCPACANWHQTVYPDFKAKYVDTGKVRYVFREFLAGAPDLADAGFMIALCANEDDWFKNIKLQFDRQSQILTLAQQGQAREAYVNLAKSSGLSEDEFVQCMANDTLREEYMDRMQSGIDMGVAGTPAFVINGELKRVFTLESIEEQILPLLGEDMPVADAPEQEPAE
ncbi:hypothetical protein GCM10007854_02890 [Algimonas porphyrae]|uniref:Thioredoxin-like fold domain-containing protein n=2 Tax=Algimonas porphyrae TaxID=1128113 RepID=A0ABQ5UY33_9PROT|nr:hypothetical protein GCM10007854_02890 [Algimonas porphyrae]